MSTQPKNGFERAPGHVEDAFYGALTHRRRSTRVAALVPRLEPARPPWQPSARSRLTPSYWRRLALRALGVAYPLQNALLDPHRWSVTVTRHAIEQAGERYGEGNPAVIVAEVAAAIAEQRVGRRSPHRRIGAWGSARHAWTPGGEKIYVIRRSNRTWIVITALPTEGDDG